MIYGQIAGLDPLESVNTEVDSMPFTMFHSIRNEKYVVDFFIDMRFIASPDTGWPSTLQITITVLTRTDTPCWLEQLNVNSTMGSPVSTTN